MNAFDKVAEVVKRLSAKDDPAQMFFYVHHTTARVAKEAGVSPSTAARHIQSLGLYRGYSVKRFNGRKLGVRWDDPDRYSR